MKQLRNNKRREVPIMERYVERKAGGLMLKNGYEMIVGWRSVLRTCLPFIDLAAEGLNLARFNKRKLSQQIPGHPKKHVGATIALWYGCDWPV
jgi:hypothetical protein